MSGSGAKRLPSEVLKDWPSVDIDEEGIFKYVLIEAYAEDQKDGQEHTKLLVRGYKWAEYHADIYDREEETLRKAGLDGQCLGGGRIQHEPSKKYLKVYGYSVGFGKADHSKTVDLLAKRYPDYKIDKSDEGY